MLLLTRFAALLAVSTVTAFAVTASADDYEGPDGYKDTGVTYDVDVSHDGYLREGQATETEAPTTYVVVESEEGTTEQVDGETVIVVQEPQPVAATRQAPPPPKVVVSGEQIPVCAGGIWVDGYWYYGNGEYLWVDGHCVVERVNYVFVHPRWDFYANVWWFVPGYYHPWGVYVGFGYFRPWFWYPPYFHSYYPAHRPAPVHRSVARRPTTAHPTPAPVAPSRAVPGRHDVSRARAPADGQAPAGRSTVIYRAPTGAASAAALGRAGTGPMIRSVVPGSSSRIVSQPPVSYRRIETMGTSSSTRSRGTSIGRSRHKPSGSGSGWSPSSGSSRGGIFGGGSSTGSSGRSGRGGSAPSGGSGRGSSAPSGRGR